MAKSSTTDKTEEKMPPNQLPLFRRYKIVPVLQQIIVDMLRKGFIHKGTIECVDGVPIDAKFVTMFTDLEKMTVYFVFEHISFPETPLGEEFPVMQATLTSHRSVI